jgi:hypothetical protein
LVRPRQSLPMMRRVCNTPSNPWIDSTYSWQLARIIYCPHRPTRVFCAHFVLTHAHSRKLPGQSPIPNCSKLSTLNLDVLSKQASEKEDAPCWYGYSINSINPWARIAPSHGPGYHNSPPLEDRRPFRSTPIQEPPLLAKSVWLVLSYDMPCDHFGPTCAMRHIPKPPSPHTPMKPRGSALIPLVTPYPIPGSTILTPCSSLESYIVPTDQHESFVRTLSSLTRTRENFPVGHSSQIAPIQARLTWRLFWDRLPKKNIHLVGMDTLLILLSLGPRYHHPRGQDIIMWPVKTSSIINPTSAWSLTDSDGDNRPRLYPRASHPPGLVFII